MSDESVAPSELLARFLFGKNEFSKNKQIVRDVAFMPRQGETSVFRISGLEERDVWDIGAQEVAPYRPASMKGRADLAAQKVLELDLTAQPDEPPERHAVIAGWPRDRDDQLSFAQELAAAAELRLVP